VTDVRIAWEERARSMGPTRRGVLFKGFTEQANDLLHAWHARLVQEVFAPLVTTDGVVVDLGCGYGRLSRELAASRPDIFLVGQDISHEYCLHVRTNGMLAVQGELAALPFRAVSAAGALAVTSLMYMDRTEVSAVFKRIRVMLQPGAPLLVIDPGEELRMCIARLARHRMASSTGGSGFHREEYRQLAQTAGFNIVKQGGNPYDSMLLLLTAGGRLGWRLASKLVRRDGISGGYSAHALHRWLLLQAADAQSTQSTAP